MNLSVKMSLEKDVRAIRSDIAAEQRAIRAYTAHAEATEDESVRMVLLGIAREEKVHVGELQELLSLLTDGTDFSESKTMREGKKEVDDLLKGVGLPPGGVVGRQIGRGMYKRRVG